MSEQDDNARLERIWLNRSLAMKYPTDVSHARIELILNDVPWLIAKVEQLLQRERDDQRKAIGAA